jgi:hypothetical protein
MLRKGIPVAAALTFVVAGCAGDTTAPGSEAECTPQIRVDGVIYSAYDYTEHGATKYGVADEADCEDEGREASGSVFPDAPQQVAVWTFGDYSSDQVLGVRFGEDSFTVFISDSVEPDEAERIAQALRAD